MPMSQNTPTTALVTSNLGEKVEVNEQQVNDMLNNMQDLQSEENTEPNMDASGEESPAASDAAPADDAAAPPAVEEEVDPAKALEDAIKKAE